VIVESDFEESHWSPAQSSMAERPRPLWERAAGEYAEGVARLLFLLALLALTAPAPRLAAASDAAPADPPAVAGAMAPNLAATADGCALTWLEPAGPDDARGAMRLRLAHWTGDGWSAPVTIAERDDFWPNWADVPSLAEAADGSLLAHWPQRSGPGTYAYDVVLARSTNGGVTWQTLGPAHDDGTETEHGFVSLVPQGRSTWAFWLDGRAMATEAPVDAHGHGSGDMALRAMLVSDVRGDSVVLDPRVCECCGTAGGLVEGGPIIVYRDRDDGEVRDISIVRRVGLRWTEPAPVHADGWQIAGCPVNGPALAVAGERVIVAWYTGAGGESRVRAAISGDGGATFGPAVAVDDDWAVGRVDVVLDEGGEPIVSWIDAERDTGAIMLRRVSWAGALGPPVRVATVSMSRATGFPRMARVGEEIVVVWTVAGEKTRLRAARVAGQSVPSAP
jgi:hypothetical protein